MGAPPLDLRTLLMLFASGTLWLTSFDMIAWDVDDDAIDDVAYGTYKEISLTMTMLTIANDDCLLLTRLMKHLLDFLLLHTHLDLRFQR